MTSVALHLDAGSRVLVENILAEHLPDREVWVFGSRAGGQPKPYSDLDLAIMGQHPLPLGILALLTEAFDESSLPFKIDLVDWATCSSEFRQIIEARHHVLRHAESDES